LVDIRDGIAKRKAEGGLEVDRAWEDNDIYEGSLKVGSV
jgi:hypothetical protein